MTDCIAVIAYARHYQCRQVIRMLLYLIIHSLSQCIISDNHQNDITVSSTKITCRCNVSVIKCMSYCFVHASYGRTHNRSHTPPR